MLPSFVPPAERQCRYICHKNYLRNVCFITIVQQIFHSKAKGSISSRLICRTLIVLSKRFWNLVRVSDQKTYGTFLKNNRNAERCFEISKGILPSTSEFLKWEGDHEKLSKIPFRKLLRFSKGAISKVIVHSTTNHSTQL